MRPWMPKIVIQPSGREVPAEIGDSLLDLSKQHGLGIQYSCDGVPNCGTCRVVVLSGWELLSPIERKEEDLIGTSHWLTRRRLSCQARFIADGSVVLDVSEHDGFARRSEERRRVKVAKAERERLGIESKRQEARLHRLGGVSQGREFRTAETGHPSKSGLQIGARKLGEQHGT